MPPRRRRGRPRRTGSHTRESRRRESRGKKRWPRLLDWRRRRGWRLSRRNDCSERNWWPKRKKLDCMPNAWRRRRDWPTKIEFWRSRLQKLIDWSRRELLPKQQQPGRRRDWSRNSNSNVLSKRGFWKSRLPSRIDWNRRECPPPKRQRQWKLLKTLTASPAMRKTGKKMTRWEISMTTMSWMICMMMTTTMMTTRIQMIRMMVAMKMMRLMKLLKKKLLSMSKMLNTPKKLPRRRQRPTMLKVTKMIKNHTTRKYPQTTISLQRGSL
mmetsp:Transcript_10647/g.19645  ORF Transcript_10647/g.19645 Transcript_10647/m.19645 type:complete len:268 (+) Transcript_10647:156-959(+)